MSRIYAVREDIGERVLVFIECDHCYARIKPGPDIAQSGWTKRGQDNGPGTEKIQVDLCPAHGER